jgi:hypothetical protein
MEQGAKTRKRILTEHAGRGLPAGLAGFPERCGAANLSARADPSAPAEGWAFVSEDGE